MKIEARWLSQKGTRTDDNRDHAGIAGRHGEFLAIVADGATNGSNNGGYARAIVEAVVDWFAGTDDAWGHELMQAKLREIHQALRKSFPTGSASIIVFHVTDKGSLTVLHSGDCLLGRHDGQVHWLRCSPILGHRELEFSGVLAQVGVRADEPFMSEIGTLLPIALCGRNSL